MGTGSRAGMSAGRGRRPPDRRERLVAWVRARRHWTTLLGLLLVLDLGAVSWLWLRPTPSRLAENQAQKILDNALGPGRARLKVMLESDGRAVCMAVVPPGQTAQVTRLLGATLGLAAERGDSLSVVEVAPPPSSPWPALWSRMALGVAAIVGVGAFCRLLWWLLVRVQRRLKWALRQLQVYRARRARRLAPVTPLKQQVHDSVRDCFDQDPLSLQVSRNLLALANPRKGAFIEREIVAIRRRLASERGALLPPVPVVEGPLDGSQWRLLVREDCVAQGQLFGAANLGQMAQELGQQLFTELSSRAGQWLGLEEVDWMLQQLTQTQPALVKLVLARWKLAEITQTLRLLLQRGVSIRDLVPILEKMAELPHSSSLELVELLEGK
ncbi:FHIPEP family type III secretion protein [bacterium]|nr:FHIPEP family type III secretion protein [bacterium]